MFTGMIGTDPAGVTTVIRTNDQNIIFMHYFQQFRQSLIKVFECGGITFYIAAMSVKHVEINKICEHNGAILRLFYSIESCIE